MESDDDGGADTSESSPYHADRTYHRDPNRGRKRDRFVTDNS